MSDKAILDDLRIRMGEIESGAVKRGNRKAKPQSSSQKDESKDAFKKIVALVNASDKSERMVRERLARDGFPFDEAEEAIERAKGYGFIDDARYAQVLIRSRLNQGKGAAGIERELAGENIDISIVEGWPYEFGIDEQSEVDRALALLQKSPSRSKNKREGAYRKLVQKGYSSSVATSAARIWSEKL